MTYNYNYNHSSDSYGYNATYATAGPGAGSYSRYNPGFDERVNDRASQIFWDAVSVTSSNDRNSIALSQYHSVQELSAEDQNAHLRILWQDEANVDFVLAYYPNDRHRIRRQIFEKNLYIEGLLLDRDETQDVHFLKIHVTFEVLCRYAEILKFKFPIRLDEHESDEILEEDTKPVRTVKSIFDRFYKRIRLDELLFPPQKYEIHHEYSRDKSYLFNIYDIHFFPSHVRKAVVNFILERTPFADNVVDNQNCIGIEKLLSDCVYISAYPIHDGHHMDRGSQRFLLFEEWARLKNWVRLQPLDAVKNYFGVKIALYFSWLGFYTNMLIFPSILGILTFFYGIVTMFSNDFVNKICDANDTIVLCPKCDECDYTKLSDTCVYSRINHILDNNFVVFFAICMAVWAALYLEFWKRYSAGIVHRWGLEDYCRQAEHPRPAYLARIKHKRRAKAKVNPVTRQVEPTLSLNARIPNYILSSTIVALYILISIAVVMALIVYRMSTLSSKHIYQDVDPVSYRYLILLPVTTGIFNLIVITVLNYLYDYLAVFLTDLEYRRTQTEYDNSLSLKIYLFQFINYYSSLFYIAFLKGKWTGTPAKYNRIFQLRQEECSPGGCLMELFIQLAIIMVGKQTLTSFFEIGWPFLMKHYRKMRFNLHHFNSNINPNANINIRNQNENVRIYNQWTKDFKLNDWNSMGLFHEYLEMVLQYGFCTLFVVAFPLAPFFALINNIFELRLDARKFLMYFKRPVPKRVKNIGIWLKVMSVLCRMSIFTTAFIIAFVSNFIPRLVHDMSPDLSKMDYLDYYYAYFNTKDFENGWKPPGDFDPVVCRYPEFRSGPNEDPNLAYKRPIYYWKILAARLAFILIFQNLVSCLQTWIDWLIPDIPAKLDSLIKREKYLVDSKIIQEEKNRLKRAKSRNDVDFVNGGVYFEAKS